MYKNGILPLINPRMHFKGRDIVSIKDFTRDEIDWLVAQANSFQHRSERRLLEQRVYRYLFWENSTRTRSSTHRAAEILGMDIDGFSGKEGTSVSKNERLRHTIEMYVNYGADIIAMRHGLDGSARYAANQFSIPIINCGDGRNEHPTQALLDLATIQRYKGRLDNLTIGVAGDLEYGRTVHSLVTAFRHSFSDVNFLFVSPLQFGMPEKYKTNPKTGAPFDDFQEVDLEEAVAKSDVLYMTRMQLERITDPRKVADAMGAVLLTPDHMRCAKDDLIVMHPLPNDAKNPTIHHELDDHQQSKYFAQAGIGVDMRWTLLAAALGAIGDDFKGDGWTAPVRSNTVQYEELSTASTGSTRYHDHAVHSIGNGVVIDHIPKGLGLTLYSRIKQNSDQPGILAENLHSQSEGRKDLIKIVGAQLDESQLNMIGVMAPRSRVNIIADNKVVSKFRVHVPDHIKGLLECDNVGCISRAEDEHVTPALNTLSRDPMILECEYCGEQQRYDK